MQKLIPFLVGLIVALTVEWAGASAACYQGCCPTSGPAEHSFAVASKADPMSSVDTDDIRKAFNSSSQKVRIVALLSPMCGGVSIWPRDNRQSFGEVLLPQTTGHTGLGADDRRRQCGNGIATRRNSSRHAHRAGVEREQESWQAVRRDS